MSFWSRIVCGNYLATVFFAPTLAVFVGAWLLFPRFNGFAFILPLMSLYLIPGFRAIRRMVVRGALIPPELLRERPVVAGVVSLTSAFGHFGFAICVSVIVDIGLAPEWPDDVGGPILLFFTTTLLWYVIALLCGELVLVGSGESDGARASRSAPH